MKDGDSVTITLKEKFKYLNIKKVHATLCSNNRSDYTSDESFANYRKCRSDELGNDSIDRSASPFVNKYNRVNCVNKCIKNNDIAFLINLAGKDETLRSTVDSADKNCFAVNLYKKGKCVCLGVACNYRSKSHAQKIVSGLKSYVEYCVRNNNSEPVKLLIHCREGKDRTGFVCALLFMLCGASYNEVLDDYMKTYENYYSITKESDPDKYNAIKDTKFDDFVDYLLYSYAEKGSAVRTQGDFHAVAVNYLKYGGMSEDQIATLKRLFCTVS